MIPYRGRCPVCSGALNATDIIIECENGDFRCTTTQFEGRWEEYEKSLEILTEVLLEDLKSYNEFGGKNESGQK